jgi:hypothetical protein
MNNFKNVYIKIFIRFRSSCIAVRVHIKILLRLCVFELVWHGLMQRILLYNYVFCFQIVGQDKI